MHDLAGENSALYKPGNGVIVEGERPAAAKEKNWTFLLTITGFVTTFGAGIPTGYNIGVINAPAAYIKEWCNETIHERYGVALSTGSLEALWSSIVSIFLIGGVVGSLGGAYVADKLGRKKSFLLCGLFLLVGAVCFQFCRLLASVELLMLGRILVGLAAGLTTSTVPMYLTEIAPLRLRGTFGVLCSMGLTGGVVVGQVMSLQEIFGTADLWEYALSSYVIMVIVCFVPYPWLPESPKYLYIIKGNREKAFEEIHRLGGRRLSHDFINQEIDNMKPTTQLTNNEDSHKQRSLMSVLKDKELLLPLVLVCALQGGQQLSGINAVFYYSVSIFESVGLSQRNAELANLGAGCLNLFVALFSPILMTKFNRRFLAILSCSMCAVFLLALTFSVYYIDAVSWFAYACIGSTFLYIFFYQIGLGPIPFFIGTELFEVGPRPIAMSLGSLSSWTCNFIVGMLFPTLKLHWGALVFLPFCITCIILTVLLKIYLPETRGHDANKIAPLVAKGFKSKPLRTMD